MVKGRLNWGAVSETLALVRELRSAGVCMCETLGAPCWTCRLENTEAALVRLLRDSGYCARVHGAWLRACSQDQGARQGE